MASDDWPKRDEVNDSIEQFDATLRDAEQVRGQVDRRIRQKPVFPDRRQSKRWQTPVSDSDTSSE